MSIETPTPHIRQGMESKEKETICPLFFSPLHHRPCGQPAESFLAAGRTMPQDNAGTQNSFSIVLFHLSRGQKAIRQTSSSGYHFKFILSRLTGTMKYHKEVILHLFSLKMQTSSHHRQNLVSFMLSMK